MSYPLRLEDPKEVYHISSRTIGSKLWFVNNKPLNYAILAYLAKYSELYEAKLYSFILMGNHYHLIAKFPKMNKAAFMRSFNAIIAKLVGTKVETFKDGHLWSRRYSDQVLLGNKSIEHWWFYCALNPVTSGIARTLREYESYNSFSDAVSGRSKEFKVFERWKYNEARHRFGKVDKRDFIKNYSLKFARLEAYEEMEQVDYKKMMWEKLEERRVVAVEERLKKGLGFATEENRKKVKPGARPRKTKKLDKGGFTPIVLCLCTKTKYEYLEKYFIIVNNHYEVSEKYRAGDLSVEFPPGTYRPPCLCLPEGLEAVE
ncbi:MAG: transposase [Bdellovibrionales bacterium]|nr:transposase [Bdellovibrionales bacterium]